MDEVRAGYRSGADSGRIEIRDLNGRAIRTAFV